ncbi:hypothetical protein F5Y19DRAFT_469825 [Xylariaceae sp. FL1651]|nr:hypothetical protein F5Y19DRAFT_469825 [Xylariaceae sp. FL1651]
MAITCLPTFPFLLFGIVEPALLVLAYITALKDPFAFYATQAHTHELAPPATDPSSFPPQAQVLTLQLANVFLLLAALAVVCSWTTRASVARWYLVAVALADYGHVWACYVGLGADVLLNPAEWNDMLWGSVGASLVLNVVRLLTLAGVFGPVRDADEPAKKKSA